MLPADIGDMVVFCKAELELFIEEQAFELRDELIAQNEKISVALEFFDNSSPVASAVLSLSGRGTTFCTDAIMVTAGESRGYGTCRTRDRYQHGSMQATS